MQADKRKVKWSLSLRINFPAHILQITECLRNWKKIERVEKETRVEGEHRRMYLAYKIVSFIKKSGCYYSSWPSNTFDTHCWSSSCKVQIFLVNLSCEIIWAPAEYIHTYCGRNQKHKTRKEKQIYICWRSKTEAGTYGPESFPILTKTSTSTISGIFFKAPKVVTSIRECLSSESH